MPTELAAPFLLSTSIGLSFVIVAMIAAVTIRFVLQLESRPVIQALRSMERSLHDVAENGRYAKGLQDLIDSQHPELTRKL